MTIQILGGSTSQTVRLFIQDTSKTDGSGLTGLVHNTSGLTAYYAKGATGTATAITLATHTAGGAWTSGGFVAVDGTNMPGVYRLDVPNAALDSEVETIVMLRGAANMVPVLLRVMGGKAQANAVTVADKTDYTLSTAGVGAVADGVCDELLSGHTTPGTVGYILGGVLIATNFNQRTVQVTGGPTPHIAASIHNAEPNSIPAGALTAAAIAEIQFGLALQSTLLLVAGYTDTEIAAIKAVTDKLNTGLVADGPVWLFTANMLELAPAGGGGQAGPGADQVTIVISDNGVFIDDCSVWISSDAAGLNVIAGTLVTNSVGEVKFLLDAGVTYYLWAEKSGMTPITGKAFVAVADEVV